MIISISPVFGTHWENNDTLTVDIDGPGLWDPVWATYYEVMYSGQRRITTAAFTVVAACDVLVKISHVADVQFLQLKKAAQTPG